MAVKSDLRLAPFDGADYLDSEETIAEYLAAALENPDQDVFLAAVADVAKVRGMTAVAAGAGLGRESLYKALRPGAQPRFDTVRRLLYALGVRLDVSPHPEGGEGRRVDQPGSRLWKPALCHS